MGEGPSRLKPIDLFSLTRLGTHADSIEKVVTAVTAIVAQKPPSRVATEVSGVANTHIPAGLRALSCMSEIDICIKAYEAAVQQCDAPGMYAGQRVGMSAPQSAAPGNMISSAPNSAAPGNVCTSAPESAAPGNSMSAPKSAAPCSVRGAPEAAAPKNMVRAPQTAAPESTDTCAANPGPYIPDDKDKATASLSTIHETLNVAFIKHMHRKMVGYAYQKIYLVQDLISIIGYENDEGVITEKSKRYIARLQNGVAPWIRFLAKATTGTWQSVVNKYQKSATHDTSMYNVYMRFNLDNKHTYIGYTGSWDNRIKEHHKATCNHRKTLNSRCKHCREHLRYIKHRTAEPHQWLTIPLVTGIKSKLEAKRVEAKIINMERPTINASEKPFWMLRRSVYESQKVKIPCSFSKKPPWSKNQNDPSTLPYFTTYEVNEVIYMDFKLLIDHLIEQKTSGTIRVKLGRCNLTRWRTINKYYGQSIVKMITSSTVTISRLDEWKMNDVCVATLVVHPHKTEWVHPTYLKDIHKFIEHVKEADEEELSFLWRTRNNKLMNTEFNTQTIIWNEIMHRYPGVQRRTIKIKLPHQHSLDLGKIKQQIFDIIEKQSWPDYIKNWQKVHCTFATKEPPAIADVLVNVNKPWKPTGCTCKEICKQLSELQCQYIPPEIDGHIFIIGREYDGPMKNVLNIPANNIPQQSKWDCKIAYNDIRKQLPEEMQPPKEQWEEGFRHVYTYKPRPDFVMARELYQVRKLLKKAW